MDEEKTIDEAVEEPADEMKEIEPVTFDDIIKDEPVKETAPVLRALGDPDPADMTMIHKHLDNFLAMLCGETPIDDNVRNSTEYWLKRLADGLGGSTKKVYAHPIRVAQTTGTTRYMVMTLIVNDDPTPFTLDLLKKYLDTRTTELGASATIFASGYYKSDDSEITSVSYIFKNASTGFYGIAGGLYNDINVVNVNDAYITNIFPTATVVDQVYAVN